MTKCDFCPKPMAYVTTEYVRFCHSCLRERREWTRSRHPGEASDPVDILIEKEANEGQIRPRRWVANQWV